MEDVILMMVFISLSGHPDPPALARDIAKRNGFHSLGPLLKYVCHAVKHITPTYHNISPLLIITYHPYLSMYTVKHITLPIPTLGTHPHANIYHFYYIHTLATQVHFILQLTL